MPTHTSARASASTCLRVCLHSGVVDPARAKARREADVTYVLRGQTEHFRVSFDQSLGEAGQIVADAVLATCERDYNTLRNLFGGIALDGLPFDIFLNDGFDGASHEGCAGTAVFCDMFSAAIPDVAQFPIVGAASDVFMANQTGGWDCSQSNGEALSRVLAAALHPDGLNPAGDRT